MDLEGRHSVRTTEAWTRVKTSTNERKGVPSFPVQANHTKDIEVAHALMLSKSLFVSIWRRKVPNTNVERKKRSLLLYR